MKDKRGQSFALQANPIISKPSYRSPQGPEFSMELVKPPKIPAGRNTPRKRAKSATADAMLGLGVVISPSGLEARWSPNGANVRVACKDDATVELRSLLSSYQELRGKCNTMQTQINGLIARNVQRDREQDVLQRKIARIHMLARRFLFHFARTVILDTRNHAKSLSEEQWTSFKALSNQQMSAKLGYPQSGDMSLLRPTSSQHSDHTAAAHTFQMAELLAAVTDLSHGPERNLCAFILNLIAGHQLI